MIKYRPDGEAYLEPACIGNQERIIASFPGKLEPNSQFSAEQISGSLREVSPEAPHNALLQRIAWQNNAFHL